MSKIISSNDNQICTITINNPDKRNAFDNEMSNQVINCIQDAKATNQRAIVIQANLSHGIFSAGHDLSELTSADEIDNDPMFTMFEQILQSPLPIIAKVTGDVYAGSLHLLMVCDMVYATNNCNVIITANKMGVPFSLSNYKNWISVMGIHKIKELFFTASKIDANDAYNAGIFNAICATEDELNQKIQLVCEQIIACCSEGISNSKLQLNLLANHVGIDYKDAVLIEQNRHEILNSSAFHDRVKNLLAKLKH